MNEKLSDADKDLIHVLGFKYKNGNWVIAKSQLVDIQKYTRSEEYEEDVKKGYNRMLKFLKGV